MQPGHSRCVAGKGRSALGQPQRVLRFKKLTQESTTMMTVIATYTTMAMLMTMEMVVLMMAVAMAVAVAPGGGAG